MTKNCVIVILKDSIQPIQIQKHWHSAFVNIRALDCVIALGSQYSPPFSYLHEDLKDWTSNVGTSENFILLGDLNIHSALWGYNKDKERGQLVITQMNTKHISLVIDPHSKHTSETTYTKGWPDIIMIMPISLASFKKYFQILKHGWWE